MGLEGFLGVSLAIWCVLSGSLGGLLLQLVALHAVQEIGSALGVVKMLNSDGDLLGQNPSLDPLVDDDTEGMLGHVEHTSGLAVIRFVGHTFLESTVTLDINDVSKLVGLEVS